MSKQAVSVQGTPRSLFFGSEACHAWPYAQGALYGGLYVGPDGGPMGLWILGFEILNVINPQGFIKGRDLISENSAAGLT